MAKSLVFKYLAAPGPLALSFGVRVWAYDPGHSKLLLRGFSDPESESGQTIVDMVFLGVTRFELDTSYPDVVIRHRETSDDIGREWDAALASTGDKAFVVESRRRRGLVIAERLDWATVGIQGYESSALLRQDREALAQSVQGDVFWM